MKPHAREPDAGRIYLDYNSTTPLDPTVLEAMLPWLTSRFANAASQHRAGRIAADAVERARESVASLIGCSRTEIVFTSGATEANNLALQGSFDHVVNGQREYALTAIEHKSVLDCGDWLASQGAKVRILHVRRDGVVDTEAILANPFDAGLVSVMLANNETGVLQPVKELVAALHPSVLVHTDATQAAGRVPIDVRDLNVHLASLSAHKLYGPKGVGALYVRRGTPIRALLHGGGHERGLRSGTLNVPGIVGFGVAADLARSDMEREAKRTEDLIALLWARLSVLVPDVEIVGQDPSTGQPAPRLPNTLNLRFPGVDAEAILANTPQVALSTGSACSSHVPGPSHVLTAMLGRSEAAEQCIRFSVGRGTTEAEIAEAAQCVAAAVRRVDAIEGNARTNSAH